MDKHPCVYILTNKKNGTLYVGVTSNLAKRIWQHKNRLIDGFTKDYALDMLVWFEVHDAMESAILREKRIKRWRRNWKLELVNKLNPYWHDLYDELVTESKK